MISFKRIAVIDLESTSREPAEAHIVEWAAVVIEPPWFGEEGAPRLHTGLVKPPIQIPPETSAVHHIIDADVADAPIWMKECERLYNLLAEEDGTIAVAHNASYEREILVVAEQMPVIKDLRWLCTYKAALRVWPQAPGHSNEALRYFLQLSAPGLQLGRAGAQRAHSAAHDAQVTALLFLELLKHASIEDMLKWTEEPALLPTCPIGEWRGKPWGEVDYGFLDWILRKIHDREDVRFCARMELDRRAEEERQLRAARANTAAASAAAAEDEIPF